MKSNNRIPHHMYDVPDFFIKEIKEYVKLIRLKTPDMIQDTFDLERMIGLEILRYGDSVSIFN